MRRSLGTNWLGKKILEKHPNLKDSLGYQANDFGAIVASAALAHDIGNPPFGHSGEKAIGEFFKSGEGLQYKEQLTAKEYQDLCDFEGNANGLKIVTQSRQGREGGLRLSYATLGAFTKYPKESLPKKPTNAISDKKYGFFQTEKDAFIEIASELGMVKRGQNQDVSYARHPLAFLVEAADDICYTIIDFEDGINLGLVPEEYALEYLIKLVRDTINKDKYAQLQNTQDRLSYLRALAINTLINEAATIFLANEDAILKGEFNLSLLDKSKYEAQINDIINLSVDKVYRCQEVIDKEIIGYEVIKTLLSRYTKAVNNTYNNKATAYDKLLLNDLPKTIDFNTDSTYERLLNVSHFVSLLSDSQAILRFNKLKGVML